MATHSCVLNLIRANPMHLRPLRTCFECLAVSQRVCVLIWTLPNDVTRVFYPVKNVMKFLTFLVTAIQATRAENNRKSFTFLLRHFERILQEFTPVQSTAVTLFSEKNPKKVVCHCQKEKGLNLKLTFLGALWLSSFIIHQGQVENAFSKHTGNMKTTFPKVASGQKELFPLWNVFVLLVCFSFFYGCFFPFFFHYF